MTKTTPLQAITAKAKKLEKDKAELEAKIELKDERLSVANKFLKAKDKELKDMVKYCEAHVKLIEKDFKKDMDKIKKKLVAEQKKCSALRIGGRTQARAWFDDVKQHLDEKIELRKKNKILERDFWFMVCIFVLLMTIICVQSLELLIC